MSHFLLSSTRNIIFEALKIGQNNPEITNLEFKITVSQTIRDLFLRMVHSAECKIKQVAMQVVEFKDEDLAYKATKIIFSVFFSFEVKVFGVKSFSIRCVPD